jgi:uncharacterized protein (DUF983 family)
MKFWLPWSLAALVDAVVVGFFAIGLADGSVSSFNLALWVVLLAFTSAVTGGSLLLKKLGRPGLGALLALVLAVPGLLAGLLLLVVLLTHPRWN